MAVEFQDMLKEKLIISTFKPSVHCLGQMPLFLENSHLFQEVILVFCILDSLLSVEDSGSAINLKCTSQAAQYCFDTKF